MPRATPIRSRHPAPPRAAETPTLTSEWRRWVSEWKERAVQALPTVVPVDVKVAARRAVETALASYGPEDPVAELQDLVTSVVRAIKDQWIEETRAQEREARKAKLLQCAEEWIDDVMVTRLPSELVGAPHSPKRLHVLATLRQQIRQTLSTELTGDETVESVIQRVQEELATWAMEQNPEMDRRTLLRRLAPWAVTALAGGIAATAWSPELRTGVRTGVHVLKERLTPYKPFAKQLWASGMEQVELWAKSRAQKKDPS